MATGGFDVNLNPLDQSQAILLDVRAYDGAGRLVRNGPAGTAAGTYTSEVVVETGQDESGNPVFTAQTTTQKEARPAPATTPLACILGYRITWPIKRQQRRHLQLQHDAGTLRRLQGSHRQRLSLRQR